MMEYKVIVGIDQSKLTIDAALLMMSKLEQLVTDQFENNAKGFKSMIKWVQKQSLCSLQELLICIENTGLYSYPLSVFCQDN
jgi:transposase